MVKKNNKKIPMDKILNITKELNPDDLEVGEMAHMKRDLQSLIEEEDDSNPDDDDLLSNRNLNFAKENPTHNPNPDEFLYLQGYEGEMIRGLATAEMSDLKKLY